MTRFGPPDIVRLRSVDHFCVGVVLDVTDEGVLVQIIDSSEADEEDTTMVVDPSDLITF